MYHGVLLLTILGCIVQADDYVKFLHFPFCTSPSALPFLRLYSNIQRSFAKLAPDDIVHFRVPLTEIGIVTAFDLQDLGAEQC